MTGKRRCDYIITTNLKEITVWTGLTDAAQGPVAHPCEHVSEHSASIKGGNLSTAKPLSASQE
jgi:hypothetical protein